MHMNIDRDLLPAETFCDNFTGLHFFLIYGKNGGGGGGGVGFLFSQ